MAVPQERLDPGPLTIHGDTAAYASLLTPDALAFLADLHHRFDGFGGLGGLFPGPCTTRLTAPVHCR
jgi:hypothetical protein